MSRQAFCKAYKEYGKYFAEKEYEKCMAVFPKLDLNDHYLQYKEQVDFVLRSACQSLSLIKNPKIEHKVSVAKAFNDVFSQLSTTTDYANFFSILNTFTNGTSSKGLERYLPLFTNLSPCEFDPKSWLQHVNEHLFQVLKNANIIDDHKQTKQKEIYLQLTCTLLFFVNVESQRTMSMKKQWQFNESLRFLKNCTNFRLFHEGDTQYSECFKMLSKFLECLCLKAENGEFADGMQNYLIKFKNLVKSNKVRATLIQDIFITLAKITKICEQRFTELANIAGTADVFDFIGFIGNGVINSKTEKTFSCQCEATGIHLSYDIAALATKIYLLIADKGPHSTTAEKLGVIIRVNFEAISKLTCSKAQYVQQCATNSFRSLMKICEPKEIEDEAAKDGVKKIAELTIQILKTFLKRYHRIRLTIPYLDEISMINHLFSSFYCAEQWDEMNKAGYLLLAFVKESKSMTDFSGIAYKLAKKQKEIQGKLGSKSPFDHFNQIDSESLYGFTLPNNFSLVKLSLAYLKIGLKYGVMSTELSNKIIHQLLMSASKDDFSPLRFVLFTQSMNFDRITTERVEKLTNVWQVKGKTDHSIGLQLAAIKYHKFNFDAIEWTEKHKDLHISQALSEEEQALETNVFKEITFDCEKKQISTLRFIKEKFVEFTEHYINRTEAEQTPLEDEKDYLLRELKMVANQFIVRGYIDDGLDLYMALYRLSIAVDDEFGLIDSCSFFAECSAEFKQKFPFENLKTIVEKSFNSIIIKLKDLNGRSIHKTSSQFHRKNQLYFCLLNFVLFYYEDGDDFRKKTDMILSYVFTSIGGLNDKNMGDCLTAATGINVKSKKTIPSTTMDSEAVRIKFYAVLFTIVTKYNAPSVICPSIFIHFVMAHVKKYVSVHFDTSAAIPILLYNMLPQMVVWLHSIYEVNPNYQSLVLTLLKLAIRSGYALRAASLMITLTQSSLLTEDLKYAKMLFMALESIMLSSVPIPIQCQKQKSTQTKIVDTNTLCEPIRKKCVTISPIIEGPPNQVAPEMELNTMKFLREHSNSCDCGICFGSETKFQMFCAAVAYARFVYLNEDEFTAEAMRSVFNQLLTFWEGNRKDKSTFARTDTFYVVSARMLLYTGHYCWKFENDWDTAVAQLKRGLKGLDKVKYGACLTKQDLELQITNMEETIKENHAPRVKQFLKMNQSNRIAEEITPKDEKIKKPVTFAQKISKPQPSLLEMISESQVPSINFQIHDDSNEASSMITPNVKKSSRNRLKKIDDAPIRTPSHRMKPIALETKSKTVDRPKRTTRLQNLTPTMPSDICGENDSNIEMKSTPEIVNRSSHKNDNEKDIFGKSTAKRNTRKAVSQSK